MFSVLKRKYCCSCFICLDTPGDASQLTSLCWWALCAFIKSSLRRPYFFASFHKLRLQVSITGLSEYQTYPIYLPCGIKPLFRWDVHFWSRKNWQHNLSFGFLLISFRHASIRIKANWNLRASFPQLFGQHSKKDTYSWNDDFLTLIHIPMFS